MIDILTDGLIEANTVVVGIVLGLVAVATLTYLVLRTARSRTRNPR
jgi:hypothetical protein